MRLKPKQAGALIRHSSFIIPRSSLRCVGWAWASPSGRNPLVKCLCRFNSCPTHSGPVRRLVMPPVFQAGQVGSKPTRAIVP